MSQAIIIDLKRAPAFDLNGAFVRSLVGESRTSEAGEALIRPAEFAATDDGRMFTPLRVL